MLTLSLLVGASAVSSARPSKADLEAARAKYDALNARLSLLDEQVNQANIELQKVKQQLSDAKAAVDAARAEASEARDLLSARARAAYTGTGSQLEILLGSTTFSEFADRLEYVTQVAQSDADVATAAEVARQRAIRETARFNAALRRQQAIVSQLQQKKAEIQRGIEEQRKLVEELQLDLAKQAQEAREAARRAAAAAEAARQAAASSAPSAPTTGGGGISGPPPSVSGGAQAAVQAAYSVLGVPYQWGGSSPESGFDCSGLTMWAWAHGGVSLPHSSSAQYYSLPHVSSSDLQPGDLVFFYTPIHHVGIYVGGDQMIHAPHSGSYVQLSTFSTYPEFVGAARPG